MKQVRVAMLTLSKRFASLSTLLSAVLLLRNIQFIKADTRDFAASVANVHMLQQVVQLLGVSPNELVQTPTNRMKLCLQDQFM